MPTLDEAFGPRPPLTTEAACEMGVRSGATVVILVEVWSDQAALETLAHRRGLNLAAERIVILPPLSGAACSACTGRACAAAQIHGHAGAAQDSRRTNGN
jgi:hypothetical protein